MAEQQSSWQGPHPEPVDADVAAWVQTLNDNQREYFEERAAMAEFDAGHSRQEAEQQAMQLTKQRFALLP
ncbi:MAG: hypothetical protein ACXV79_03370 [Methylobacter sp.]